MIDKILRKIVTELAINNKNKKYIIDEKQKLITIVRVLYQKMDIKNILE